MTNKRVFVTNYTYMRSIIGLEESLIYRNTLELIDALQNHIEKRGKFENCLIGYKCKPDFLEGDVIFDFIEETENFVYFEFITTIS